MFISLLSNRKQYKLQSVSRKDKISTHMIHGIFVKRNVCVTFTRKCRVLKTSDFLSDEVLFQLL